MLVNKTTGFVAKRVSHRARWRRCLNDDFNSKKNKLKMSSACAGVLTYYEYDSSTDEDAIGENVKWVTRTVTPSQSLYGSIDSEQQNR